MNPHIFPPDIPLPVGIRERQSPALRWEPPLTITVILWITAALNVTADHLKIWRRVPLHCSTLVKKREIISVRSYRLHVRGLPYSEKISLLLQVTAENDLNLPVVSWGFLVCLPILCISVGGYTTAKIGLQSTVKLIWWPPLIIIYFSHPNCLSRICCDIIL